MLEQFLIFTRGGLVLWKWREMRKTVGGSLIDSFIGTRLVQEEFLESPFERVVAGVSYKFSWSTEENLGLVFVAVHESIMPLDELVSAVKDVFIKIYHPKRTMYADFTETFNTIMRETELKYQNPVKSEPQGDVAEEGNKWNSNHQVGLQGLEVKSEANASEDSPCNTRLDANPQEFNMRLDANPRDFNMRLDAKTHELENGSGSNIFKDTSDPSLGSARVHNLRPRASRKHEASLLKESTKHKKAKGNGQQRESPSAIPDKGIASMNEFTNLADTKNVVTIEKDEFLTVEIRIKEEEQDEELSRSKSPGASLTSAFKSIGRNKILRRPDLNAPLKALGDDLMEKKLIGEVANKVCDAVAASLEDKKFGSVKRISLKAQGVIEEALMNTLTPVDPIDIQRDISSLKRQKKPYVILFLGIDKLQKAANISKVSYWLLQHNFSVMMASCDIYDTESVEQLHVSAEALKVAFFNGGHEQDPALVAEKAIQEARRKKLDVILIDAICPPKDNDNSMNPLLNVLNTCKPDSVIFVGHAALDDYGISQLLKFKHELVNMFSASENKSIDGIILTDFISSPHQVGAAVSMVHILEAPVLFVSCGNSFTELKKFSARSAIRTLLI
eukprot:TRINITY_DN19591_c0_g1_i1.p1 TRINITY_DN19591_c0_g1~~TRINITY_DN19591_c0_g1_i1.p1  ORF type:complete len:617 (+),score=133.86 TRINITY_DN19591_c0_g1_i1:321-2171(+)